MVYVCDNCGTRFSGAGKQDHCPDCGTNLFHPANQVEQHEYACQIAELIRKEFVDGPHYPNAVVTEVFMSSCFSYKLPATALQIDDPMIVEISVDFGENANRSELTANVWVRQENGRTMEFLLSMRLPLKQGETSSEQVNRIFEALNGNKRFIAMLSNFISERLKCRN